MAVTTNFWHETKPTRYEERFTIDFSVPHQRVKRVLQAGAMDAYRTPGFVKEQPPQVLISETNELGVVYKLRYWITPWQQVSPSIAKDVLYASVLTHLRTSGLTLAYPKEDIFYDALPTRHLDSDNIIDRTRLLAQQELFSMLNTNELSLLSAAMVRHEFRSNQKIVNQGKPGSSMFILFEGLLEVLIGDTDAEVTVAVITPLNYFGEMSLLTGATRSATIRCISDSIVYEIRQSDFNDLISGRNEIIEQIAVNISKRMSGNIEVIAQEKEKSMLSSEEYKSTLAKKIRNFFSIKAKNAI